MRPNSETEVRGRPGHKKNKHSITECIVYS